MVAEVHRIEDLHRRGHGDDEKAGQEREPQAVGEAALELADLDVFGEAVEEVDVHNQAQAADAVRDHKAAEEAVGAEHAARDVPCVAGLGQRVQGAGPPVVHHEVIEAVEEQADVDQVEAVEHAHNDGGRGEEARDRRDASDGVGERRRHWWALARAGLRFAPAPPRPRTTPMKLVRFLMNVPGATAQPVTVELKNGNAVNGQLLSVSPAMNVSMRNVKLVQPHHDPQLLDYINIRGNQIRQILLPEELDVDSVLAKSAVKLKGQGAGARVTNGRKRRR